MKFRFGSALALALAAALCACSGGGGTSPAPGPRATATPTVAPATPTPTAVATPTPVATATPVPSPSPTITPAGSVTIEVSQATNAHAYSILLQTNDMATFTQNGYSQTVPVSSTDASTFFTDLNANTPVSGVQTQPSCNKSSSFGTTTTLVYMASTSGDVSCPPSAQSPAQTLYTDANKIEGDVSPQVGGFHH